jgi:hypothetical protein
MKQNFTIRQCVGRNLLIAPFHGRVRRNALRLLRPTDCRHAAIVSFLVSNQETRLQAMSGKMNSTHMIGFKESMN